MVRPSEPADFRDRILEYRKLILDQLDEYRLNVARHQQFIEATELRVEQQRTALDKNRQMLVALIERFNADALAAGVEPIEAPT
jgi:uncharacterized coiled-coil protein SlyX